MNEEQPVVEVTNEETPLEEQPVVEETNEETIEAPAVCNCWPSVKQNGLCPHG